jgi:AcrR family transcriptional regulator
MTKPAVGKKAAASQPRGDAVVKAVLSAALAQLAEGGFAQLSIPDVAAAAGVNKTSIYRRWPTKDDLVRDALRGAMGHADHAPDTGSLRGDLIALVRTVGAFMQSGIGQAVVRILLAEGGNAELRALGSAAYQGAGPQGPWLVLQRAVERGEWSRSADPSLLLFTLAGAVMHRVWVEQREVSDTYIQQLVDMVLQGASPRPAKARTRLAEKTRSG